MGVFGPELAGALHEHLVDDTAGEQDARLERVAQAEGAIVRWSFAREALRTPQGERRSLGVRGELAFGAGEVHRRHRRTLFKQRLEREHLVKRGLRGR